MHDLVMFDLDGTLVETAPEIADAVNDLLHELGLPTVAEDLVKTWIGHGTRELMTHAYAHAAQLEVESVRRAGTMDKLMPRFVPYYERRCGTRSRLYPDVLDALRSLRTRKVRLAVVTNKEGRYVTPILMAQNIRAFFDLIVAGDTLAAKKPDPLPLQHCLDRFQVRRERALFVGDSQLDVQAARAAGVEVWAVPYGYNMGQPIADSHPDRLIATMAALSEAGCTAGVA
jgi:phosphoglycolate phosphatase